MGFQMMRWILDPDEAHAWPGRQWREDITTRPKRNLSKSGTGVEPIPGRADRDTVALFLLELLRSKL